MVDPLGLAACPGGEWDQDFGDFGLQAAFGGYFSGAKITLTCRAKSTLKCKARQICIGGGAIAGAGFYWALGGASFGANNSNDLNSWSGWGASIGSGPIGGQGGGDGIQTSVGPNLGWKFGVAAIRCYTYSVRCTENDCPVE